jgi:RNA polymerase sigma factor (sigma-70 family)
MNTRKPSLLAPPAVSTADALALAMAGHDSALNDLFGRYLPTLKRSAHGRLPSKARDRNDTDDIVQDAVVGFLKNLERFKSLRPGALLAFMRLSVTNRVRDEVRRAARSPEPDAVDVGDLPSSRPSPHEQLELAEISARYEAALAGMRSVDRQLILGVELGYGYDDLAAMLGKPTARAARMAAGRAFDKLVMKMATATSARPPGNPRARPSKKRARGASR